MTFQYPPNQFLENGVLYSSVRQYLSHLTESGGQEAFTDEMWEMDSFGDLFTALARRHIDTVRRARREQARSRKNIILNVDSYKISMPHQYPPGTRRVYSYVEARGGSYDEAVLFGVQMFAQKYLTVRVTEEMIEEAAEVYAEHGEPFYREGWEYIVRKLGGRLPILIRSVPEGTRVPPGHILASIENTDDNCWWLTTHLETPFLRAIWYPTTVASRSLAARKIIARYLERTSDHAEALLPSRLHDFGARGATSSESAAIGGLAHLTIFEGTDTVQALQYGRRYYSCKMAGRSVPAAEHSTITAWGREREIDAYRNMLRKFAKPGAVVSCVSDSYDLWNAIDAMWGIELRDHVVNSGAVLVVRPDSGDILTVPVEAVRRLDARFGSSVNSKGYKVLNHVRVLQGDGINDETVIEKILAALTEAGYATDNIIFGMGGGLLQKLDRDTMRWAMKASAVLVGETWYDVYKDPVTDPGKRSKPGRLALVHDNDNWETVPLEGNKHRDLLENVYLNGEIILRTTLDDIRARARRPARHRAAA